MAIGRDLLIVLVRHGPTGWNAVGRIQGHTDVPLSAAGRQKVATWKIPLRFQHAQWVSSPLKRALETAAIMGCNAPDIEPLLMEMSWGEWEGLTLTELRGNLGADMQDNEARGLDFKPAGGESPRQVKKRIESWLAEVAVKPKSRIVVTHKGVIRAAISLATQWDMKADPPFRIHWDCAQVLRLSTQGEVSMYATNLPLTTTSLI